MFLVTRIAASNFALEFTQVFDEIHTANTTIDAAFILDKANETLSDNPIKNSEAILLQINTFLKNSVDCGLPFYACNRTIIQNY